MKLESNEVSRFATQRTRLNANISFENTRRWAGLELLTLCRNCCQESNEKNRSAKFADGALAVYREGAQSPVNALVVSNQPMLCRRHWSGFRRDSGAYVCKKLAGYENILGLHSSHSSDKEANLWPR